MASGLKSRRLGIDDDLAEPWLNGIPNVICLCCTADTDRYAANET
jgi:hypothetical protein